MGLFGGLFGKKSTDALFEFKEYSQGFTISNTDTDAQGELSKLVQNHFIDTTVLQNNPYTAPSYAPPPMPPTLPHRFREIKSMTDLDHAVFKTDIETLVNLWIAKYGTDWVDKATVMDDEFFEFTVLRLRSIGRLEEHTIVDPALEDINSRTQQMQQLLAMQQMKLQAQQQVASIRTDWGAQAAARQNALGRAASGIADQAAATVFNNAFNGPVQSPAASPHTTPPTRKTVLRIVDKEK